MPYEPLYHKYRPQSFAELVGQDAISTTLSNALRQQRIAHAYLLTGPRGTGKTSSARILAKSLNCIQGDAPTAQPCGVCEICRSITQGSALDVIEIDAASNTGVDNIRELIERSQFAPAQCRYKVYVIDECHMLSTAAFNALLKTLEEPPPRVVFILATTDPQRVLPTIISRCQRFDFRRIPLDAMVDHLTAIAAKESIQIQPEALKLVGQLAQGGLRDAESLLDQLSLLPTTITVEAVWDLVGAVPEQSLLHLVQVIHEGRPELVLESVRQLMDRGREPLIVLQSLASFYRDMLIAKTAPDRMDLVAITPQTWQELCVFVQPLAIELLLRGQQHLRATEVQVKNTTQPRLWLEVTLLGLLPDALAPSPAAFSPRSDRVIPIVSTPSAPPIQPVQQAPQPVVTQPESQPITSTPAQRPPLHSAEPIPRETIPIAIAESTKTLNPTDIQTSSVPITSVPPATAVEMDLNETWSQVISHVQPTSTQVLVRQQCRLLAFRGPQARIGVTTQALMKLASSKLPNIEAAFESLFQRIVKVTVEVIPTDQPPSLAAQDASASQPFSPQQIVGDRTPPAQPQTTPISVATVQPVVPQVASPNLDRLDAIASPPIAPSPNISVVQPIPESAGSPIVEALGTIAPQPPPVWHEPDELDRAARSIADFFRGQVVNLEGKSGEDSELSGESFGWDASLVEPDMD